MDNRFGKRVRMLRKMLGVQQAWLAEMVDVSPEFMSRIERSVSTPSFKLIYKLAEALETDPANFFLPVLDKAVAPFDKDIGYFGAVGLMSRLGSWEQNLITGEFLCSDSFYLIYGYRPREVPATRKTFRKHTHPEDLEKTEATWQAIFVGQAVYNVVFRIIRKDGVERTLIATCEVELDQDGTPFRVFGSLADITENLHFDQYIECQHALLEERVREKTSDLQTTIVKLRREIQERTRTEIALQQARGELEERIGAEEERRRLEQPQTNGVAERFNRTLKEQTIHGRGFQKVADVRRTVAELVERYNDQWLVEKNGFRSPRQTRRDWQVSQEMLNAA